MMNRTGATLATTTDLVTVSFFPDATEWRQQNLSLLNLGASTQFRMKFEFTSNGGNNLWLDDIQLTTITGVSNLQDDNLSLQVRPNPSEDLPVLIIERPDGGKVQMEILDVLGRSVIWSAEKLLEPGENRFPLQQEMTKPKPGTYWVRLIAGDRVMVRQWVVLP
jgi:hypothetical protein